ncbi:major capsid protein [Zhihengliuella halotolerans]|uniref:major capsid protein n=1 Tax=Zhihengliuella halotolerans TaxID=370736 RepID=UPI000C80513C|nr:major capsid protein [Zhihengliuella halotolerans]
MYPEEPLDPQYLENYLSNPTRVRRQIAENIKDRSIADYAFGQGNANQGAVVYDVITGEVLEGEREAEEIAPGASFPIITVNSSEPKLAKVDKYGGAAEMLWDAIRRNETDTWASRQRVLEGTVIKKVNRVSVKAIEDAPLKQVLTVGAGWSVGSTDVVSDILAGKSLIDDQELGYTANLALINPLDAQAYLLGRKDVREQFPKESRELNPVLSADIDGLANLEWIKTNRVPRGKMYIMQRGVFGSVRDELNGLQTNVYDNNDRQLKVVQAWRNIVPIITDPKALLEINGIGA